jgi:putative MATE family efflux protein
MMISMFIQALYNMVDSMFVAQISEDALTAVSLAFPVQNVITAIAVGLGVGLNAVVPRYLGMGRHKDAQKAANVTIFLSACFCVIFVLLGLFLVRPFYLAQTADEAVVENGVTYLSIVCVVSVGAFYGQNFEKMLVSFGHTVKSMISQAVGAIINIIFDPLLIFGIGFFPKMGVAGAAVATVMGQIIAAIVAMVFVTRKDVPVRLRFRDMAPDWKIIKELMRVGIPSMITVGLSSVMSFCINQILLAFSKTATAVFGIWIKLQNFAFMPVFGMNNGTVPMISYNYGAKNLDRVNGTIRLALKVAIGVMAAFTVLFEVIPEQLLRMFDASDYMMSIGVPAMRICCLSFIFGGITVIFSSSFQSVGRSSYTLVINLCRQLIFMVPIAWLMSLSGNLNMVWAAVVIDEVLTCALASVIRVKTSRQLKSELCPEKSER